MSKDRKIHRVIMFHGLQICNNVLNIWSDAIAVELRKKGIEVGFIDLNKGGESLADEYVREINKGADAAIALNSYGQHETTMAGERVFDYLNIPFFNWILDHPCEHTGDILSDLKDYHIICIDRDHVEYITRYFPKITGVHFIPLGAEPSQNTDVYTEDDFINRKYNIIFTGSCFSLQELGGKIGGLPKEVSSIATDVIEYMIDNREANNEIALRSVLRNRKIELSGSEFRDFSYAIAKTNPFVRAYIRKEMVCYAAESGAVIDLFGEGWDELKDMENVIVHGSVSYMESINLCSESKISFNVMPLFKDGLHDRIPTAMLRGSAVMTDSSKYIEELFDLSEGEKELLLYDLSKPELIGGIIRDALGNPYKLYETACRGRKKAEMMLTWEKRVDELIKVMEDSV